MEPLGLPEVFARSSDPIAVTEQALGRKDSREKGNKEARHSDKASGSSAIKGAEIPEVG